MTLSELSIRRPVFAWMLMSALIIFGGISVMRMGVSQLPDVDFPVLSVNLSLPGAAPAVMESDVVDVVENALMTVEGIKTLSSSSRQGSANITIEFDMSRNIDTALQEVQTKLQQAQRRLPDDLEPPTISKTNPEDQPIIFLRLNSDRHTRRELMVYARDRLQSKLSTAPGVGSLQMNGFIDPTLRIWVSRDKLNDRALTVTDIINTVQNEHAELPGGIITAGDREYNVRTLGEANTPEEFSKLRINTRGGGPNYRPIALGEVATIEDGLADIRRLSRANGKPTVGMGIIKQRGSNAVEVAKGVKKQVAELSRQLPPGMDLAVVVDTTTFIENNVGELKLTLVLAAILTGLVCWGFLGGWSSTVNVLLAIPTSVIGSFTVLYFAGFTLNTFTLLGLSLAIGIVVDDAIMMLENIVRHQEHGEDRVTAAIKGSKEITFAAIAATISIVAIFLPVAFMSGVIGRFFFQYGVTITVAVLLSLVEALTLTPMRCAAFVETGKRTTRLGKAIENSFDLARTGYRKWLAIALTHRTQVVAGSMVFFLASIFLVTRLNKEFTPFTDQGVFMIRMRAPVGSSLDFTDSKAKEIEKVLASRKELDKYMVNVGGGDVASTFAIVAMKERGHRGRNPKTGREFGQLDSMNEVRKELKKIPGVIISLQDMSARGFTASRGFPVEFTVRGPDWGKLAEYSGKLADALKKNGLMTDVDTDYRVGMPEVEIIPDRAKASARGVSVSAIGQTINALVGGVIVGRYQSNGHRADINVRLQDGERNSPDSLKQLLVRNNRGELIPLPEVARFEVRSTLQSIARVDRERAITVTANVAPGKSQSDALASVSVEAAKFLPDEYHVVMTGSAQTFTDSFRSLGFALILGIIVAYMVLASQFNSFIDPVTVLMALPFSVSGALVSLWMTGQSLSIYSFIGLILLMGIVKKNSILLVDFTNQVGDRKKRSVTEGLLEACPIRLRPILMTSLATIAGAVPAAINFGAGAETRKPMAIAVIGGVLVSTVLTLFVVPCVYSFFSRWDKRWIQNGSGRNRIKNGV